jgi:hypothetical protein
MIWIFGSLRERKFVEEVFPLVAAGDRAWPFAIR